MGQLDHAVHNYHYYLKAELNKVILYPYIFIICEKYLDRYIHFMSIQERPDLGIKLTKDGPKFHIYVCL